MAAQSDHDETLTEQQAIGRNEVVLLGRVSGDAEERELPSGDRLVCWRVVVARPPGRATPGRRAATSDTFDCVARSGAARRSARGLLDGDVVALEGGLRRRFWRSPTGAASRYEIEVERLQRVRRRAPA
jgi:single-strand DNA-binding protein